MEVPHHEQHEKIPRNTRIPQPFVRTRLGALAEGALIEAEGTDVADSITVGLSDDGSLVQVTSDDGTVLAEGDVDEVKFIVVDAGGGDDTVTVEEDVAARVNVNGGAGADTLTASNDYARLNGGDDDDDIITVADGDYRVLGGDGADEITAGDGYNLICGGDGDDTITAGDGENFVSGGANEEEEDDVDTDGSDRARRGFVGGGFGPHFGGFGFGSGRHHPGGRGRGGRS